MFYTVEFYDGHVTTLQTLFVVAVNLYINVIIKPPPHEEQVKALRSSDVPLFVCLFVCRQKVSNLELWSLLTTYRSKFYVGFSKNLFLDPYDDLQRQQTSPRAPWRRGLIVSTHRGDTVVYF